MNYILYRLHNTTKDIEEFVWGHESDPVPTASLDNPGDEFQEPILVKRATCPRGYQMSLDLYKHTKLCDINTRTEQLIRQGFSFGGKQFSLSVEAQSNWQGVALFQDLLTFPLAISTKDDGEYLLQEADLAGFLVSGVGTVNTHLASGRALKVAVNAAQSTAEVDAVVDSR